MSEAEKPAMRWKVALVLMPALLMAATIGAVAWKIRVESQARPDARLALAAAPVSRGELRQNFTKLSELVGVRDWESVEGRKSVRRAIAFIGGTLSPQNYGFDVQRDGALSLAEELWTTLWVDLEGSRQPKSVVLVAVPYDRGNLAVGAVLAIANDLRDDELAATVRLVFYPSVLLASEPEVEFLAAKDETVAQILCVNRLFGSGDTLWLADGKGDLVWDASTGSHPGELLARTPQPADVVGPSRPGDHASLLAEELRIFGPLKAPLVVCRGSPMTGEEPRYPFQGIDESEPVNELLFDHYVTRTILLRNLIREMAQRGPKRP